VIVVGGIRMLWGLNVYAEDSVAVATFALAPSAADAGAGVRAPLGAGRPPPATAAAARRLAAELEALDLAIGTVAPAALPDLAEDGLVALLRLALAAILDGIGAPGPDRVRCRAAVGPRPWDAWMPLEHAPTARGAFELAAAIVRRAAAPGSAEASGGERLAAAQAALAEGWRRWAVDLDRRPVLVACRRHGLRWRRPSYAPHSVQLGEGRHQRLLMATVTDSTGFIAAQIAQDKMATNHRLHLQGLPVARQRLARGLADAERAAEAFGLPVVVKPRDGRWNRGVSVVWFREDLAAALEEAGGDRGVLVESHLPGAEYRILVAAGRMIAAHRRDPPAVTGDGRRTVAALIEHANGDPRQVAPEGALGGPIRVTRLTEPCLRAQGLALDAVPAAGRRVPLCPLPFRKYGGHYRDVSDGVHPDNAALAVEAARVMGLDIAGIDLRTADIARPWRAGPGGICEVNAGPGLDTIAEAGEARGLDVAVRLIDAIWPPATRIAMPFVLLSALDDLEGAGRATADALARARGWMVGLALPGRFERPGYVAAIDPDNGPQGAVEALAECPSLDAAVVAFPLVQLYRGGIGRDRVDVAVIGEAVGPPLTPGHGAHLRHLLAAAGARVVAPGVSAGATAASVVAALGSTPA